MKNILNYQAAQEEIERLTVALVGAGVCSRVDIDCLAADAGMDATRFNVLIRNLRDNLPSGSTQRSPSSHALPPTPRPRAATATMGSILDHYVGARGSEKTTIWRAHKAEIIAEKVARESAEREAQKPQAGPLTAQYRQLTGAAKTQFWRQNKAAIIAESKGK